MKKRAPAQSSNRILTLRIGRDAATGMIWVSQQLGAKQDPREELSLTNLCILALEFEAMGDDEAAEFVRNMVECIEHTPLSEALEASYRFPDTTSGQKRP